MTAIPGGNNSGIPGVGVGGDTGGSYHQRDEGGAAADMMGSGAGIGASAHGLRRDNNGTEPGTARPPQSIDNSMREGGNWAATDPESFLRENLSLKDLVSLAYMFNFVEAGVLGLGERKAVVQVKRGGRARALFRGHLRKARM